MDIRLDDPRDAEVARLLREHVDDCAVISPPESCHALEVEGLLAPGISLWTARDGEALLGCGALRELDPAHGEIKSMRTVREHLRRGVASRLLEHILAEAGRRAYGRLSLETGVQDEFAPARALYAAYGFAVCGPFGDYVLDPNSVFMTREL